jgi:hypothetical protein
MGEETVDSESIEMIEISGNQKSKRSSIYDEE